MWDTDATIDVPSSPCHRGRPVVVPPVEFGRKGDSGVAGPNAGANTWACDWDGWMRGLPPNALVLCTTGIGTSRHVLTMARTGLPTQALLVDPHPVRAYKALFEALGDRGSAKCSPALFTAAQKRHAGWDEGWASDAQVDAERASCLHKRACSDAIEFSHDLNLVKTEGGCCPRCHVFLEDRTEHVANNYCPPPRKESTRGMKRFNARTHTFSNKPRNVGGSFCGYAYARYRR